MSEFLSTAAQNVVARLHSSSRGNGSSYTPIRGLGEADVRVASRESLGDWFRRVADAVGGSQQCMVEPHIALVGVVKWRDGELTYVNIQALVTAGGTIEAFCRSAGSAKPQYFRLELDLSNPGPLFKEPLPHVHTVGDGAPRFPFVASAPRTLIIDFLEFLYLNYDYNRWLDWARATWRANPNYADDDDPFTPIVAAYAAGQTGVLGGRYAAGVRELKRVLRAEKSHLANGWASMPVVAALLSY